MKLPRMVMLVLAAGTASAAIPLAGSIGCRPFRVRKTRTLCALSGSTIASSIAHADASSATAAAAMAPETRLRPRSPKLFVRAIDPGRAADGANVAGQARTGFACPEAANDQTQRIDDGHDYHPEKDREGRCAVSVCKQKNSARKGCAKHSAAAVSEKQTGFAPPVAHVENQKPTQADDRISD